MSVVVVISQHLLNVFVQLANKRGFNKKKNMITMVSFKLVLYLLVPRSLPSNRSTCHNSNCVCFVFRVAKMLHSALICSCTRI
jgi:hypothetical protein